MSEIHSVHSLPETEATESKCTIFPFLHKRVWTINYLGRTLALADSVHSVGIVSELTTLQTVPPQEAPVVQPVAAEPQIDLELQIGQPVNVPYLPQCKYYLSILQFSLRIPHISSLLCPVADSFSYGVSDHYPWYASLGSITFGWYDHHMRDMLRDSIQQFSEFVNFLFIPLGDRPNTPM